MGPENGRLKGFVQQVEVAAKMKVTEAVTSFEHTENIRRADNLAYEHDGVILAYANHTQHLNIQGFARIADMLKYSVKDFYVPTAWTLTHGGQNQSAEISKFANNLQPLLERKGIHFLPVARVQDLEGIEDEQEKRYIVRRSIANKRQIRTVIKEGDSAIFAFPEGTTRGGLQKEDGTLVGIIDVENNLLEECVDYAMKVGRELVFLPTGMVDYHRIVKPRTDKAEPEVAQEFKNGLMPWRRQEKLARVVYGEPFLLSEALQDSSGVSFLNDVNRYLMQEVANLLPEEARGVYR